VNPGIPETRALTEAVKSALKATDKMVLARTDETLRLHELHWFGQDAMKKGCLDI
jgi:hypothetical protein